MSSLSDYPCQYTSTEIECTTSSGEIVKVPHSSGNAVIQIKKYFNKGSSGSIYLVSFSPLAVLHLNSHTLA